MNDPGWGRGPISGPPAGHYRQIRAPTNLAVAAYWPALIVTVMMGMAVFQQGGGQIRN